MRRPCWSGSIFSSPLARQLPKVFRHSQIATGVRAPEPPAIESGEALTWWTRDSAITAVRPDVPKGERLRHRRKYAEGTLGPDKSFYFTGGDHKLRLRAQNLAVFTQIAEGIDEDTWLYHLRRGDYSQWMRDAIKDNQMAEEIASIERAPHMSATETRTAVIDAVNRRYSGSG